MTVTRMEPLVPRENKELTDLATELVAKASGLAARLSAVAGDASECVWSQQGIAKIIGESTPHLAQTKAFQKLAAQATPY
jgi:hypothetical protein